MNIERITAIYHQKNWMNRNIPLKPKYMTSNYSAHLSIGQQFTAKKNKPAVTGLR
jgi:hypothetical protein